MWSIILTLIGLSLFEIVCSIDNAVINAGVLQTMSKKSRRWFLGWGILIAVFGIRGILPWLIVWVAAPTLGALGSLKAIFTFRPEASQAFESAAPLLLAGAGSFLAALFLHWLFLEEKRSLFPHEHFLKKNGPWFWVCLLLLACAFYWYGASIGDLAIGHFGLAGIVLFSLTYILKRRGEMAEEKLMKKHSPEAERQKIIYLEVIDGVFSVDAILGALAFTFSVPLILIGNGIGAIVMRQFTVQNITLIKKFPYLKHGAMYAIGTLSLVMILEVAGTHVPEWVAPVVAIAFVVAAFTHPAKA